MRITSCALDSCSYDRHASKDCDSGEWCCNRFARADLRSSCGNCYFGCGNGNDYASRNDWRKSRERDCPAWNNDIAFVIEYADIKDASIENTDHEIINP